MNAHDTERFARHAAANITNPLSRDALAGQYRVAVALISGTLDGLHLACGTDNQIACSVESQLASALFSLRMAADRIAAGNVYEPATHDDSDDLVDQPPVRYMLTPEQLADRDEHVRQAALAAAVAALATDRALVTA